MSDRGNQLFAIADQQISQLDALLFTADETSLRQPCTRREKLGDGTAAAVAQHIADTYQRIAQFLDGHSQPTHPPAADHETSHSTHIANPPELIKSLSASRRALNQLTELTDEQLDSVPPAGKARFCDGQRTLEQILASMLKHQGHQVDALRTTLTTGV